jgi:hypothetical protein
VRASSNDVNGIGGAFVNSGGGTILAAGTGPAGRRVFTLDNIGVQFQVPIVNNINNDTTTGTVLNMLAKFTPAQTATVTSAGDLGGAVGIVVSGAGTAAVSAQSLVAFIGVAHCVFDNTAVIADYFTLSATTAGNCHDSGANYPSGVQVLGRVADTTTIPPSVYLFGTEARGIGTDGNDNTASGAGTLVSNTTGSRNTATGHLALSANTTGNNNTAVGNGAGSSATTGSNNIYIGHNGFAAEGSTIRIGTGGTQTKTFIAGISGVTTGLGGAKAVVIDSNGQLGTVSSSRRFKEDIRDMGEASQRLLRLRPVAFRYRQPYADGSKPLQYGLIAEEVAEVLPELVAYGRDGQPETVMYHILPAMLLNEVQQQHRQIEAQQEQMNAKAAQIWRLTRQVQELQKVQQKMAALEARLARAEMRGGSNQTSAVARLASAENLSGGR